MLEEWRKVEEFPAYSVSNLGRVKNDATGAIKKTEKSNTGYYRVHLFDNGKHKHMSVHRLVASAFIPNPENKQTVNHKNEDKSDNRASNLEWMTGADNTRYGTGHERATAKQRKRIIATSIETGERIEFGSMKEAEEIGFNHADISECCNGKRNHHKGFVWSFA